MAADHTKNRLKAAAHTLTRQLDGRKKRKMPKEKKF